MSSAPPPAAAPAAAASDKEEKAAKKDKKPKKEKAVVAPAVSRPKANPEFIQFRVKMWDELKKNQPKVAPNKIVITLPDGKSVEGIAGQTTPLSVASGLSKSLAEKTLISKVNGVIHDAWRPIESDCKLELFDFESAEGKSTFWHSSSHLLGLALEAEYGANLCMGPPLEEGGFYYDAETKEPVRPEDFKSLQDTVYGLVAGKHDFERLVIRKEDALEMFKHNPFKQEIISSKIPDGGTCTVYRCGPFIDLCKGPHIANTGKIKAMKITKNAASYWLGKADNAPLQRVYGISFPKEDLLKKWEENMRLAAERDHRKIGTEQKLFFFHELSPGSCFFLPHGARVYNTLVELMRSEYRKRGFTEVISPNVFNVDLFKTSGHYANYKEHMFLFDVENAEFGMKPMNCPGHCLMFGHQQHSYRELPIRFADFGVLHRNEYSGALTGLTRVRRFQQDDAHIFCRHDQIKQEMASALDFLHDTYAKFGFKFILNLSTRPEKYLGDIATWNAAEKALEECLNERFGRDGWFLNPGDGAFYGPKIDVQLMDALDRKHQCATIQLDFQLPSKERFNLQYKTESGAFEHPVIIHRAILGSVERMMAVLIEHTGGKWPFWLSPRQVVVIPVAPNYTDYAKAVTKQIWDAGFFADCDDSSDQLGKKIRNAQLEQYNYILCVGEAEAKVGTVDIRTRDNQRHGTKPVAELIAEFHELKKNFK